MKKIIIPLTICCIALPFIFSINFKNKESEAPGVLTETTSVYYTLKSYKGRVALFINDNTLPVEIFELFTSSLPEADIKNLERGIVAKNENELQILLEEYLGWKHFTKIKKALILFSS